MNVNSYYRINTPHIVHDTIAGETILLNLKSGNYYSFDKIGAVIWEFIEYTDHATIIDIIAGCYKIEKEIVEPAINNYIQKLLDEYLIVSNDQLKGGNETSKDLEVKLKEQSTKFIPPVVHKYTDMKDVLLLDPIHDVDEPGWPTGKQD